jgi:hypothetical protein
VKRRWDWRCLAVIAVVLCLTAWVCVAIAMLIAELWPLLTSL